MRSVEELLARVGSLSADDWSRFYKYAADTKALDRPEEELQQLAQAASGVLGGPDEYSGAVLSVALEQLQSARNAAAPQQTNVLAVLDDDEKLSDAAVPVPSPAPAAAAANGNGAAAAAAGPAAPMALGSSANTPVGTPKHAPLQVASAVVDPQAAAGAGIAAGNGAEGTAEAADPDAVRENVAPLQPTQQSFTVFITGLDKDLVERDVRETFGVCGDLHEVFIARERGGAQTKGFGFLHFLSEASRQKALSELREPTFRGGTRRCGKVFAADNKNNLFVGNVPKALNEQQLRVELEKLGGPMKDLKKNQAGFAFAVYYNYRAAEQALSRLSNSSLEGRKLTVEAAKNKRSADPLGAPALGPAPGMSAAPGMAAPAAGSAAESTQLFIRNVGKANEQRLREYFGPYGSIREARVARNNETGESKGFGFVEFETAQQAAAALRSLNGSNLDGRTISVEFQKAREGQPPPRGRAAAAAAAAAGGRGAPAPAPPQPYYAQQPPAPAYGQPQRPVYGQPPAQPQYEAQPHARQRYAAAPPAAPMYQTAPPQPRAVGQSPSPYAAAPAPQYGQPQPAQYAPAPSRAVAPPPMGAAPGGRPPRQVVPRGRPQPHQEYAAAPAPAPAPAPVPAAAPSTIYYQPPPPGAPPGTQGTYVDAHGRPVHVQTAPAPAPAPAPVPAPVRRPAYAPPPAPAPAPAPTTVYEYPDGRRVYAAAPASAAPAPVYAEYEQPQHYEYAQPAAAPLPSPHRPAHQPRSRVIAPPGIGAAPAPVPAPAPAYEQPPQYAYDERTGQYVLLSPQQQWQLQQQYKGAAGAPEGVVYAVDPDDPNAAAAAAAAASGRRRRSSRSQSPGHHRSHDRSRSRSPGKKSKSRRR